MKGLSIAKDIRAAVKAELASRKRHIHEN